MAQPDKKLAALKIMVFSMGIVLLGGVILLGGLIYQRNKNYPANDNRPAVSTAACADTPTTIPSRSPIAQMIKNGDQLTLLTQAGKDGKQQVIMVDSCSGKVIRTINIVVSR